jgi:hypothetical protein
MKKIIFTLIITLALSKVFGQCDNYKVQNSDKNLENLQKAHQSQYINFEQLLYFMYLNKPHLNSILTDMGFVDKSTSKYSIFQKECLQIVQFLNFQNETLNSRSIIYVTTDSKKYNQLMYEVMAIGKLINVDKNSLNSKIHEIENTVEAWSILNGEGNKIGNLSKSVTQNGNITYVFYLP